MEKIRFENVRGLSLVGNLYATGSKKIIILAHGFTNDKSSQGRFEKLAAVLNTVGFDAFAFDFSGCGESDSDVLSAAHEVEDLRAAIDFISGRGYERLGLFGNSLGSLICLRCYRPEIETMVLMGALTHRMTYDWYEEFSQAQMQALEGEGVIKLESDELGTRLIGQQMLNDFEEIDQEQLLSSVKCPVLIIHGNHMEDAEELELLANSKKGMHLLPEASELLVIEGARHGCKEHMDQVAERTAEWCLRIMS